MANITQMRESATWTKGGPVVSRMPADEIVALEEKATATVGDPSTLGLWAFATGTWIVGTAIGGIFPAGAIVGAAPVLLVFAGIAQFIAGLYAYRRTQSLPATAFCCFGAFNTTVGLTFLLQAAHLVPETADTQVMTGFLLESFGFIALALAFAAAATNWAILSVLITLGIGYACSGIPYLVTQLNQDGWGVIGNIGGWFLCASAFFAYYTGMALAVNSSWKRVVLPIGGEP